MLLNLKKKIANYKHLILVQIDNLKKLVFFISICFVCYLAPNNQFINRFMTSFWFRYFLLCMFILLSFFLFLLYIFILKNVGSLMPSGPVLVEKFKIHDSIILDNISKMGKKNQIQVFDNFNNTELKLNNEFSKILKENRNYFNHCIMIKMKRDKYLASENLISNWSPPPAPGGGSKQLNFKSPDLNDHWNMFNFSCYSEPSFRLYSNDKKNKILSLPGFNLTAEQKKNLIQLKLRGRITRTYAIYYSSRWSDERGSRNDTLLSLKLYQVRRLLVSDLSTLKLIQVQEQESYNKLMHPKAMRKIIRNKNNQIRWITNSIIWEWINRRR